MMNDTEFLRALDDGSLPPEQFTHRNHLRAAWLFLEKHPLPKAAMYCSLAIQKYAAIVGKPDKFHLTLTLAFMHIIAELKNAYPVDGWQAFIDTCPDLETNAPALLQRHYSDAVLSSDKARKTFVPPDRDPLPLAAD